MNEVDKMNEYNRLINNPEEIKGVNIEDITAIFKSHRGSPNDLSNYISWYYQNLAIKQSEEL